jgi:hypothetical protein
MRHRDRLQNLHLQGIPPLQPLAVFAGKVRNPMRRTAPLPIHPAPFHCCCIAAVEGAMGWGGGHAPSHCCRCGRIQRHRVTPRPASPTYCCCYGSCGVAPQQLPLCGGPPPHGGAMQQQRGGGGKHEEFADDGRQQVAGGGAEVRQGGLQSVQIADAAVLCWWVGGWRGGGESREGGTRGQGEEGKGKGGWLDRWGVGVCGAVGRGFAGCGRAERSRNVET